MLIIPEVVLILYLFFYFHSLSPLFYLNFFLRNSSILIDGMNANSHLVTVSHSLSLSLSLSLIKDTFSFVSFERTDSQIHYLSSSISLECAPCDLVCLKSRNLALL
jgi:hypothetical protein